MSYLLRVFLSEVLLEKLKGFEPKLYVSKDVESLLPSSHSPVTDFVLLVLGHLRIPVNG